MNIFRSKAVGNLEAGTVISVISQTDADGVAEQIHVALQQHAQRTITDGYSEWSIGCPTCKTASMEVVRPGKVQCARCG